MFLMPLNFLFRLFKTNSRDKKAKSKIFFVHIPKTGGSTVIDAIGKAYPNSLQAHHIEGVLVDGILGSHYENFHFMSGHLPYTSAYHSMVNPNDFNFISVIRQPIRQFYSVISYTKEQNIKRIPGVLIETYYRLNALSLEDFLCSMSEFEMNFFTNPQSRTLSGIYDVESLPLDQLYEIINSQFALLGTTENLGTFLTKASEMFNLGKIPLNLVVNRTKKKIPLLSENSPAFTQLENMLAVDIEIYKLISQKNL
jgi:hypothetical protein